MQHVECLVVGAGVVGLAIARALAGRGREVLVLESTHSPGTGISSRNSEVIHAGLYYPAGSLKARLCVRGRRQLYAYCESKGTGLRKVGKLVVATATDQLGQLQRLFEQARLNEVEGIAWLTAAEARRLESQLDCVAAVYSPESGILDSHQLMLALQADAEADGASLVFRAPVESGRVGADGIEVEVGGDSPVTLRTTTLVNAAGLNAWDVARRLHGFPRSSVPPRWLAKGNYFSLTGVKAPFQRLIYPVPEDGGLGVHLTLDLAGRARFGPDVQWLDGDQIDYRVDPARARDFYASIRAYWPDLPDDSLVPDYAGVRPKLAGPGSPAADFLIQGPNTHGLPGLVNLFGIESPGLTACLAIGDYVRQLLDGDTN